MRQNCCQLLERSVIQLTEEPSPPRKLRREPEVARFMVSAEQETADELRQQSQQQQLEQFAELHRASFLREHQRHKAVEADVESTWASKAL